MLGDSTDYERRRLRNWSNTKLVERETGRARNWSSAKLARPPPPFGVADSAGNARRFNGLLRAGPNAIERETGRVHKTWPPILPAARPGSTRSSRHYRCGATTNTITRPCWAGSAVPLALHRVREVASLVGGWEGEGVTFVRALLRACISPHRRFIVVCISRLGHGTAKFSAVTIARAGRRGQKGPCCTGRCSVFSSILTAPLGVAARQLQTAATSQKKNWC